MAGLGRKVFTAGDVLTASDVQSYLQDQTVMNFAGTAARSSAIATPTDGMVTYNQTNNSLEAYNGTDWINKSGLQMVKKQTIGSGVSSVTVTGAFSATYDDYLIKIVGGVSSATCSIAMSLSGITTGYYTSLMFSTFGAAAPGAASNANQSNWAWAGGADTTGIYSNVIMRNPFVAIPKIGTNDYLQPSTTGQTGITRFFNPSTASATGFTYTPSTGTLTGGTIYVYGFGQ
jgi:hypothetical protein